MALIVHVKIEVWSDVVCPWCYIGKRNLEAALAGFEHGDEVEIVWRSFELDPNAPMIREGDYADRLGRKYGVPREGAQAMIDRMTATAASAGLDVRFDAMRPGNTRDAHRLLHLAKERGLQDPLKERLFAATFTEGEAIGDPDTLVRLAEEVGVDGDEARSALEGDDYLEDVRADEAEAMELGVTGVPFFLFDRRFAIPGAQAPDTIRAILDRTWAARAS